MYEELRAIATVSKTHGKKGEVVTVPVHGLPSLMHEGLSVCVVPPRLKGPRWHKVLSCASDGRGQRIALDGVSDLGAAEALVGRYNPLTNPKTIELDLEKVDAWIAKGAQPSSAVSHLIDIVRTGAPAPEKKAKLSKKAAAKAAKAE